MASAFISHASEDAAIAEAIVAFLERDGISCWVAPRDVAPGGHYPSEIIRGIEESETFVLLLSAHSNTSAFVSREVERAISKEKPIFTVRIADVLPSKALELLISSAHWIDAWPPPVDEHLAPLSASIRRNSRAAPRPVVHAGPRPDATSRRRWSPPVIGAAAAGVLIAVMALWNAMGADPSAPAATEAAPTTAATPTAAAPATSAAPPSAPPVSPPAMAAATAATPTGDPCPQKLAASVALPLRCFCDSQIGLSGSVWGTDVYTADSATCLAALHAGVIPVTGGTITAVRAEPQQYMVSTSRQGVTTGDYGPYRDTFTFAGVTPLKGPPRCPTTLALAPTLPSPFTCQCSGEAASGGRLWGTDVYTHDSTICLAARHAGVISAAGGTLTVARADDRTSFAGTTRNGVTSGDYASFSRSMKFQ